MKKKTVKKLVLAKDTVRNLEDGHFKHVAGGKMNINPTDVFCSESDCLNTHGC